MPTLLHDSDLKTLSLSLSLSRYLILGYYTWNPRTEVKSSLAEKNLESEIHARAGRAACESPTSFLE